MEERIRSADKVLSIVTGDPKKLKALKEKPLEELAKLVKQAKTDAPAYISDKVVYRIVVGALGLIAFVAAIGAIILVGESGVYLTEYQGKQAGIAAATAGVHFSLKVVTSPASMAKMMI